MKNDNMIRVESLLEGAYYGHDRIAALLNDYRTSNSYICDAVVEVADGCVSICYNDIIAYISENVEAVNDAIKEFGWDGCGGDLYKAGQMAEFRENEFQLYDNLEAALVLMAVDHLRYDLKREEIPAELADLIREWAAEIDNNDRCNEIANRVDEWFEDNEEV